MRANIIFSGLFLALILMPVSLANFPGDYWGKAYIGEDLATKGTPVSAWVNGVEVASAKIGESLKDTSGEYVRGYYQLIFEAKEGSQVIFKIGSVEAEPVISFSQGRHDRLDIILEAPACGDTICNGDETKQTCPEDCGEPETPAPPGGGGVVSGGSSGASSSSGGSSGVMPQEEEKEETPESEGSAACESEWDCSEWSECLDGIQTRDCIDINECAAEKNRPIEVQECSEAIVGAVVCGDGICSPGEDCPEDCGIKESQGWGIFPLTGQFLNSPQNVLYGLIFLLLLALVIIVVKRKKK
jgi:hypothetical protein